MSKVTTDASPHLHESLRQRSKVTEVTDSTATVTLSEGALPVQARGVYKSFGKLAVLRDVSFTIHPGSITAILGPNASGKSTLIKSILGLVHIDKGELWVNGESIHKQWEYRRDIGYMPQLARFPENLQIRELFTLLQDLREPNVDYDRELYELFQIEDIASKSIRILSGGTRQKLNAVLALWFNPHILIFDEPTVGLDPVAIMKLKGKLRKERERGKSIVLSTHIMGVVEELADQIIFLLDGQVLFDGSVAELKTKYDASHLEQAVVQLMEKSHV